MTSPTTARLPTSPDGPIDGRPARVDDAVGGGARPAPTSPSPPRSWPTRSASTCGRRCIRIRAGDSGVLPVVGGLLLISILFQSLNSNFLTAGNLVNLLIQGAAYMLLAMGEVFALLLGEIDLSIGLRQRHRRHRHGRAGQGVDGLAVVGGDPRRARRVRARSAPCRERSSPGWACRRSSSRWPACSVGRA